MSAKSPVAQKAYSKDRLVDDAQHAAEELITVFRGPKDSGFINHATIIISNLTAIMNKIKLLP